jgi:hypothetical protein
MGHRIGPGQTRSLVLGVEGAVVPCASPTPSPTSCLGLPDPALGSQLLSQGYGPKSTNVTFWEWQMGVVMVSKFLI